MSTVTPIRPQRKTAERKLETISLREVTAKRIEALMPGLLYKGKVAVLAGLPGDGKSLLAVDIAARLSIGGLRPCDPPGVFEQSRTLLMTAEDDPEDTIRPRFDVAGANVDWVDLVKGTSYVDAKGNRVLDIANLVDDLPMIEARTKEHNVKVLIIDPLTSFAGAADTNKTGEMRTLLDRLSQMAARTGVAVLIITHLNKRSDARRAMDMIAGSHVISAAVRIVLATARDPQDEKRRLVLPLKLNIDKEGGGFAYEVRGREHPGLKTELPRMDWEKARVFDITANEVLVQSTSRAAASVEKLKEVTDWLKERLSAGEVKAADMWRAAEAKKYSPRRVKDAKRAAGVVTEQKGLHGAWYWRLGASSPGVGATDGGGEEIDA